MGFTSKTRRKLQEHGDAEAIIFIMKEGLMKRNKYSCGIGRDNN
jgi:hypothetical protein